MRSIQTPRFGASHIRGGGVCKSSTRSETKGWSHSLRARVCGSFIN